MKVKKKLFLVHLLYVFSLCTLGILLTLAVCFKTFSVYGRGNLKLLKEYTETKEIDPYIQQIIEGWKMFDTAGDIIFGLSIVCMVVAFYFSIRFKKLVSQ